MKELKYSEFNMMDYEKHVQLDGLVYYIPDDESEYIIAEDVVRDRVISTGFYEMDDFGIGSEYNLAYDKTDDTYKHVFQL